MNDYTEVKKNIEAIAEGLDFKAAVLKGDEDLSGQNMQYLTPSTGVGHVSVPVSRSKSGISGTVTESNTEKRQYHDTTKYNVSPSGLFVTAIKPLKRIVFEDGTQNKLVLVLRDTNSANDENQILKV